MSASRPSSLRTWLVLARASNLPTVWSNCVAGWLLGGGGSTQFLTLLLLGTTCLYVGGMFLNDAFDADFDRQFRKERPIPAGLISAQAVWQSGVVWLVLGAACLIWMGRTPLIFTSLLTCCILLYDVVHKKTILAPVVMAGCRVFLILLAASTGAKGANGFAVWCAVVLGSYIAGLSYIARTESQPGPLRYWPCMFLAAPLVLGWLVGDCDYRQCFLAFGAVSVLWTLWSLKPLLWQTPKNVGAAVSGLLAGIVWVDFIAVLDAPPIYRIIFPLLFVLARFFQKYIPAT